MRNESHLWVTLIIKCVCLHGFKREAKVQLLREAVDAYSILTEQVKN